MQSLRCREAVAACFAIAPAGRVPVRATVRHSPAGKIPTQASTVPIMDRGRAGEPWRIYAHAVVLRPSRLWVRDTIVAGRVGAEAGDGVFPWRQEQTRRSVRRGG